MARDRGGGPGVLQQLLHAGGQRGNTLHQEQVSCRPILAIVHSLTLLLVRRCVCRHVQRFQHKKLNYEFISVTTRSVGAVM